MSKAVIVLYVMRVASYSACQGRCIDGAGSFTAGLGSNGSCARVLTHVENIITENANLGLMAPPDHSSGLPGSVTKPYFFKGMHV